MTKDKKPNRASQTKKSDSTKVETRAAEVKPKRTKKGLDSTIVLRYAQRAKWI